MISNALKSLVLLGITLLPLYLGGSGGMQISHAILAIAFVGIILTKNLGLNQYEILAFFLMISIFLRELYQVVFAAATLDAAMPGVYFLFNILLLFVCRKIFEEPFFRKYFPYAIFTSAIIALSGILLTGYSLSVDSEAGRAVGTFNNPNQLGYFSVCLFSICILLHLRGIVSIYFVLLLVPVISFLSIASLSKAAMVAIFFAVALLGYSVSRNESSRYYSGIIGVLVVLVVLGLFFVILTSDSYTNYSFVVRLMDIGSDSDDNLAGRGYNLVSYMGPLEVLFGLSDHMSKIIRGSEVHSTVGWVFINYGVVGGSLFLVFLYNWWWRLYLSFGFIPSIVVFAPPMLYGLTHNGIRFTIFWLLISISFCYTGKNFNKISSSYAAD
jgi:hypothetical protein